MKRWLFSIAALVLIATCTSTLLYAQNYYNQNTANPYPLQSGYAAGYNNTQLQGQTPYRSGSSLNANPSPSPLSSFMRNSSGANGLTKYLSNNTAHQSRVNYPPYSMLSQSVTSTPQERTQASAYTNPAYSNTLQNSANSPTQISQPMLSNQRGSIGVPSYMQQYNPQTTEMQNQMSYPYSQTGAQAQYDSAEIARSLANITDRLNALQQKIESGNYDNNAASSIDAQKYMTGSLRNNVTSTSELYSGIDQNTTNSYLNRNANANPYTTGISSSGARIEQAHPSHDSLDQIKQKLDELSKSIDTSAQRRENNVQQYNTVHLPQRDVQTGSTFQSYSQSQFDTYFNTAQDQMRLGSYLDAADSFMLASVYEPDNPWCYGGQGHALFAAGQYVNSALFIIRAIELNPDYIQANIDWVTTTGRSDIVATRIAELEQLLKKAPAAGLQFLLAYFYYRTGRLPEARQIINALYQEIPQSRATLALKMAIDTKLNYNSQ